MQTTIALVIAILFVVITANIMFEVIDVSDKAYIITGTIGAIAIILVMLIGSKNSYDSYLCPCNKAYLIIIKEGEMQDISEKIWEIKQSIKKHITNIQIIINRCIQHMDSKPDLEIDLLKLQREIGFLSEDLDALYATDSAKIREEYQDTMKRVGDVLSSLVKED